MAKSKLDIAIDQAQADVDRIERSLDTANAVLNALSGARDIKAEAAAAPKPRRKRRTKAEIQAEKLDRAVVHGKPNGKEAEAAI